jgi:nucleotide-binding universal stress UspA family protein
MKTIAKILVPVDFGEASLAALDVALDLAAKLDASVVVVNAYETPPPSPLPAGEFLATAGDFGHIVATAESALRVVVEARSSRGVKLEALVREGPPWQVIDTTAEEVGADLIVLGTRSHGVLHALLGGVAEKVVRTASKPVLTIRAPEPS